MQAIPKVQTADRLMNQLQSNILGGLNPIIQNPLSSGSVLTSIPLKSGSNTVNTGLGRVLQGWIIVRLREDVTIWDLQDSNTNPDKTLILNSSGDATIDLYVF